jgi:hypothetical protein
LVTLVAFQGSGTAAVDSGTVTLNTSSTISTSGAGATANGSVSVVAGGWLGGI